MMHLWKQLSQQVKTNNVGGVFQFDEKEQKRKCHTNNTHKQELLIEDHINEYFLWWHEH